MSAHTNSLSLKFFDA